MKFCYINRFIFYGIGLFMGLSLVSCFGGTNDQGIAEEKLLGIWKLDSEDDELFIQIAEDRIIEYDYDNDSVGGGRDCYHISFFQFTNRNGRVYTLRDPASGGEFDAEITALEQTLTIVYLMEGGNETETYTRSGLPAVSFVPNCSQL